VPLAHLQQLLHGADASAREAAWESLVAEHSRLLVHVARSLTVQHDGAMDAYAFVLERLREDGFRRLRAFEADGRSTFSTWLVVVARRLCLDYYRQRYGRPRGANGGVNGSESTHALRRRIMDLAGSELDLASVRGSNADEPDRDLRERQLHAALDAALAELGAEDRLILKLRYEDDLTGQAIASAMGLATPFHAFRRLSTIHTRLRRALLARGVEDSAP
jgi:RNA polymerase sigma factor (sigma-70 family)